MINPVSGRTGDLLEVASSDGVRLAVHDLGGDGARLLICHATGFCGMAYGALGAELAGRFHVFAVDFRGHGDSTAPEGDRFDWQAIADDLLAVLDGLGAEPVTVFGHSLGGAVSLLAAARRPGAIDFAYLYEPIVLPDGFPAMGISNPLSEGARRRRATFPSRAEAMLRYAGRPPLDTLQAGVLADYVEHGFAETGDGSVRLKCDPEHEAATFDAPDKPTIASLGEVELPVIVAAGATRGEWSPGLFAPAVAQALPGARYEPHPTLGHLGPLENPYAVAQAVLAGVATPRR
jgi:pimeloyl-ACP methyl ester carboxylesterase